MKRKISILAILLGFCMTAFAKQYVTIEYLMTSSRNYLYVNGAIPSGVENSYSLNDYSLADVINILASKGFEVESVDSWAYGYGTSSNSSVYRSSRIVIMSKAGTPELGAIEEISSDDDTEAVEVARYNLQGLPVNENERGVQIIVYSNYTTKTVIVQ